MLAFEEGAKSEHTKGLRHSPWAAGGGGGGVVQEGGFEEVTGWGLTLLTNRRERKEHGGGRGGSMCKGSVAAKSTGYLRTERG